MDVSKDWVSRFNALLYGAEKFNTASSNTRHCEIAKSKRRRVRNENVRVTRYEVPFIENFLATWKVKCPSTKSKRQKWEIFLNFQLATYSGCHGVPQKFNPKSFTPLSSKYVQFVKYWRIFCVFTADLRASRVFPSVGISSRRPVLCLQWLPPDGEKLLKFGSKESSWLPAMTSLCLKSCSPSHRLKVSTSSSSPQALKSPAWIKISPFGMSNLK